MELAETIVRLSLPDLDGSVVRGPARSVTQRIAAWAWENGYNGIVYRSRFDDDYDCWALFDNSLIEQVGSIELILPSDSDFQKVLEVFGLQFRG